MPSVLVVDNDDLELEFICSVIRTTLGEQYSLIPVHTGVQAIRAARQNRPELILMDILLPDVDGMELAEDLRRFLPDSCISFLTTCTDFYCAQKAISLKVQAYLLKPIKPVVLKDELRQMLDAVSAKPRQITGSEKQADTKTGRPPSESVSYIETALQYMHAHFNEKLVLEDIAQCVYMNPQYFSRIFKRETGTTFTEYLNRLRVESACQFLLDTDYPVYRIANECGYSDPAYFNRIFLRYKEVTPQKFRKVHRQPDSKHI